MFANTTPYTVLCTSQRVCFLPSLRQRLPLHTTSGLHTLRECKIGHGSTFHQRRGGCQLQATKKPDSEEKERDSLVDKISAPVAALVICALLSGAVIPEEAMAARSGGRMGGSAFRSRAPSMPRGGGGGYRQYNYSSSPGIAPPLVGGYGGYGLMPSFFFPFGFGGIFNIFIAFFVISSVLNAIRGGKDGRNDEDDFDDML